MWLAVACFFYQAQGGMLEHEGLCRAQDGLLTTERSPKCV